MEERVVDPVTVFLLCISFYQLVRGLSAEQREALNLTARPEDYNILAQVSFHTYTSEGRNA
jgi:hypothetical protein